MNEDDEAIFAEYLLLYRLILNPALPAPMSCRTSALNGAEWIRELVYGHPVRIWDHFRMTSHTFIYLAQVLIEGHYYREEAQTRVGILESLGIFLITISQKFVQRVSAERFQHSTDTVNRAIRRIARALCALAVDIVCPRYTAAVHPKILHSNTFYPWFANCIGALDGSFVAAYVPAWKHDAYRTRKATICQNVLAACDHDMRFVHVHCGWEGSANDGRIFQHAYSTATVAFPHPPEGKFYLVDSAFTNMPGFLAPYKQQRYHFQEWGSQPNMLNKKELFNHTHSRLRNVIERTFGLWKKRFPFLRGPMNNYYYPRQVNMVIACCVVHNFIIEQNVADPYINRFSNDNVHLDYMNVHNMAGDDLPDLDDFVPAQYTPAQLAEWAAERDRMTDEMWAAR